MQTRADAFTPAELRPAADRLPSLEWWAASAGPTEADFRLLRRPAGGESGRRERGSGSM
ncbi:hypothetical protein WJX81_008472 [Elliptochloris bilobata]|uniref:Uncharacterized protein n=1 Tax=Elliptochloris bilobata TaxID=381761 RepID=A0AAW1QMM2_9CHLO